MSESTEFSQRVMPLSRKMFAVAYHILQQGDEAEDVVQDIFVKL
ncbi:MAG: RNA polymerase subunit sigma-70, partial [Bacteroidales bacterium]|nr:RNA polymerase subunit sigma-70 [Bacteroidales bacterium]